MSHGRSFRRSAVRTPRRIAVPVNRPETQVALAGSEASICFKSWAGEEWESFIWPEKSRIRVAPWLRTMDASWRSRLSEPN